MKTPTRYKDEKVTSLLTKFAAEYFSIESNQNSLITVTKVDLLDRGRRAIVYFTALPTEKEKGALEFARRRKRDFRQFIMSKKSFGFAPSVDFAIDLGEHNRQRIDELLNNES
jgi:ribosome-binding factor A